MGWKDTITESKGSWRDTITGGPSLGSYILEGAKQGGSAGFSDELGGAMDAILSKTGNTFVPEGGSNPYSDRDIAEVYKEGRDDERRKLEEAKAAHPAAVAASEIAASIPLSIASGGGIKASAALGGAYGLGGSDSDSVSGDIKNTLTGGAIGAASSSIGNLVGAAIKKAQTATPAVSGAKTAAKVLTGIPEESIPSSLTTPEKPADWFFKIRGKEVPSYAPTELPTIPDQSTGDFIQNAVHGGAVGYGAHALGIPAGPAVGIPYALSRTATAQRGAQSALQSAAPVLKSVDTGIQDAAKFIAGPGAWERLPVQFQTQLQQAAQQGPRQLAITHFLLKSQNPEYQKATSSQETEHRPVMSQGPRG